jgi:hypothetical protein
VHFCREARTAAVVSIRHALVDVHQVELLALAVGEKHVHLLARFPRLSEKKPGASRSGLRSESERYRHRDLRFTDPPRYFLRIAKERSSKALAAAGFVQAGKVWAARGKVKPIRDRAHQVNVYRYVCEHLEQGAALWEFRNPEEIQIK